MKYNQLILFFISAVFVPLQSLANNSDNNKVLHLQTNKRIYVSGENIGYKCTYTKQEQNNTKILYVDLCGEGYTISSEIIKSSNSHWVGELTVPDSVETGVYLLRAYRGNQNGEAEVIAQLVSVINRFENNGVNNFRKTHTGYHSFNSLINLPAPESKMIKTYAAKNAYSVQEVIPFWIENELKSDIGGISFSVFKVNESEQADQDYPLPNELFTPNRQIKILNHFTIRGNVMNKTDKKAATNEMVFLSIPDSIPHIFYNYTNADGEFQFEIEDYYGLQNIVVQTQNKTDNLKITLYPYRLEAPKTIPYYIPPEVEESEFCQLAIKRATMHLAYAQKQKMQSTNTAFKYPIYGDNAIRIYPRDFFDLNNFEDIALNILPIVKYRNTRDSVYLKIWDVEKNLFYSHPTILVDGILVNNAVNLNVLNSKKINWIDIQAHKRCYGDLIMDGILSIHTYNGDFSDMKLSENALSTTIETFYNGREQSEPMPYIRDVLSWVPELSANQKMYKIDVKCSYEKGKYIAVAQTFDKDGNCYRSVFHFTVNE